MKLETTKDAANREVNVGDKVALVIQPAKYRGYGKAYLTEAVYKGKSVTGSTIYFEVTVLNFLGEKQKEVRGLRNPEFVKL